MGLFGFFLLVALGRLLAGRAQGGDDGRLPGTVYLGAGYLGAVVFWHGAFWRWAFVSSLPQVVGVGGGWRRDVVVRVSLSCFEVS